MSAERILLDTVFIQAFLNPRDQYHEVATRLLPQIRDASEVWVTEAVLIESANALSAFNRNAAVQFITRCYRTLNMTVVTVDSELLQKGLELYSARPDKTWGLTDCISFVVMREQGLIDVATADEHFRQAGFRLLLLQSGQ